MLLHLLRMRCEIEILQKYKYKLAGTMQFRRTASPKLYLPISDACPQKSELQCRKIGTLFQFAKNYTISSNRLSPIATHCHFTKSRESCYRAYPSATQTKHTRINNKKIKGGTTTKMRLQSWSLFGLTNEFSFQVEKALDLGIHVRRQVHEPMNKNEQKWHTAESNPWTKRLADALARRFTLSQNGYGDTKPSF